MRSRARWTWQKAVQTFFTDAAGSVSARDLPARSRHQLWPPPQAAVLSLTRCQASRSECLCHGQRPPSAKMEGRFLFYRFRRRLPEGLRRAMDTSTKRKWSRCPSVVTSVTTGHHAALNTDELGYMGGVSKHQKPYLRLQGKGWCSPAEGEPGGLGRRAVDAAWTNSRGCIRSSRCAETTFHTPTTCGLADPQQRAHVGKNARVTAGATLSRGLVDEVQLQLDGELRPHPRSLQRLRLLSEKELQPGRAAVGVVPGLGRPRRESAVTLARRRRQRPRTLCAVAPLRPGAKPARAGEAAVGMERRLSARKRMRVVTDCQPPCRQHSPESCVSRPPFPSALSAFPLLLEVLEGEAWVGSRPLEVFDTITDPLCPPDSRLGVRSVGPPVIQRLNTHVPLCAAEYAGSVARGGPVAGGRTWALLPCKHALRQACERSSVGPGLQRLPRTWRLQGQDGWRDGRICGTPHAHQEDLAMKQASFHSKRLLRPSSGRRTPLWVEQVDGRMHAPWDGRGQGWSLLQSRALSQSGEGLHHGEWSTTARVILVKMSWKRAERLFGQRAGGVLMAVGPLECSGASPPPGSLRHTPGHLKLLHQSQEDKGEGGGPWTGPEGQGPRGAFQRQVEKWDRSQGGEEDDVGGETGTGRGGGGALMGTEAAGIWGAGHPGSGLLLVSEPGAELTCPPSQAGTLDGQKSPTPRKDVAIATREGDQFPCGPAPQRDTTALLQPEKAMLLQG
ncbi:unnamed protein product [Rangifer tarandus platyrhynchus]|uniref:Uncharacterized protein n=1 Tax=Rangifer tarandus platyrhynchus TaxID=3082113 RepID=A0ABN8ZZ98_RANTA|nr:unnamed protein product [Rangifer tarandus platyrhynchus]